MRLFDVYELSGQQAPPFAVGQLTVIYTAVVAKLHDWNGTPEFAVEHDGNGARGNNRSQGERYRDHGKRPCGGQCQSRESQRTAPPRLSSWVVSGSIPIPNTGSGLNPCTN